jgi:threonine-phosphate decarboxylase
MPDFDHGGNVLELAAARGADWRAFVDFSASINPLGPPPELLDVMRQHQELVACYPPNDHARVLASLADYCGLTPDHLLVGNGATELIYFVLRFLGSREALVALPTFSEFPRACAIVGLRSDNVLLIRADSRRWCVDWQALEDALTARRWDLLVLVHPNNPTGATLDPARADRLLQLTAQHGVTVLLDESFIDFAPEESWIGAVGRHEHLVVLRSLTKFFAIPGLRLGYLAANPELIARMRANREPWQVNQFAQMAGECCVRLVPYQEATRRLIREERERLTEQLETIPGVTVYPSRVNFLLVGFDANRASVGTVYEHLLARGIVIRRCDRWPGLPAHCIRVAVRLRHENEQLVNELRTVLCSTS